MCISSSITMIINIIIAMFIITIIMLIRMSICIMAFNSKTATRDSAALESDSQVALSAPACCRRVVEAV